MSDENELPEVEVSPTLIMEIERWAKSVLGAPVNALLLERLQIELNYHLGQFTDLGWRGLTALLHSNPWDQSQIQMTFLRTHGGSIGRVKLTADVLDGKNGGDEE